MTVRAGKQSAPEGKFPGQSAKNGLINFRALADEQNLRRQNHSLSPDLKSVKSQRFFAKETRLDNA